MQTSGQQDAARIQQLQAQHATDLFDIGSPGIRLALGDFIKDLGQPGQEPDSIKKAFAGMRDVTNQAFTAQETAAPMTIAQQARQSGYRGDPTAVSSASDRTLYQLEAARRENMRNLDISEVNAGLTQQDFDLSQIFGIAQQTLGQSFGFTGNALGATQYNQQNPWGGALTGAAAGAAAGSVVPGWGTAIGGLVGGLAGYFSGGG